MQTKYKMPFLNLSIILLVLSFSWNLFAGGGGGGMAAPNNLFGTCRISKIAPQVRSLPKGDHSSFAQAAEVIEKFSMGREFNLLGGKFELNEKGSFDGLYSVQMTNSRTGHPIFKHYAFPQAMAVHPLNIPMGSLSVKMDWKNFDKGYPIINRVMLYVVARNNKLRFELTMIYDESINSNSSTEIKVLTGEMDCREP